ncbi:MAG TPA: ABC transporter permease [Acidobacteriaceae bacterium]
MSTAALNLPATPATGLSRTLRIFVTETRYEFLRMLRTRAFSLSVIGFPVMFYCIFGLMMNRGESVDNVAVAKYMVATYSVFGLIGAALFGIGVGMAGDLSAGWLELKRASPMPPIAYLLAKCVTAMAFGAIIVTILCILGITAAHIHLSLNEYVRMIVLTVVGAVPFASMGLVLAQLVPANAAPGIVNMIYLPMSFCGGLWIPFKFMPHALQLIAPLLPTYHLAQLMLSTFGYPSAGTASSHWIGLAAFTMIMLGIAAIAFNRREQNA